MNDVRKARGIAGLLCFLFFGCAPYYPYTYHRRFPDPYVARGVVTGSVLGAGAGAAIDHKDRGRGAALGAAGGGVLGGVLGSRGASQNQVRPWLYGKKVSVVFGRERSFGYGDEVRAVIEEELIRMGASVFDDPHSSSRRDSTRGRSGIDYAVEVNSSERSGYDATSVDIRVIDVATRRVVAIGSSTNRYGYDFGFGRIDGYRNRYYDDRVENLREAARDAIQSLP